MRCILRDGWWFLCSGSLDTDGICISKPPSLDTGDIGCLGNMHGLVCLSPLDAEGAGSVSFLDVVILVLWTRGEGDYFKGACLGQR